MKVYDVYKEIFLNWMTWKLPNYRYVNCVSTVNRDSRHYMAF